MTYRVKAEDETAAYWCPYNPALDCDQPHCGRCGWNPYIAPERKEKARRSELLNVKLQLRSALEELAKLGSKKK